MKNIVYLILTGILVLASCNDEELLDKKPHSPTDASFYVTVDGATQGLMAAYDILQAGEDVERVELMGTVCSGDAICGGEPGGFDQPNLQQAMRFQTTTENGYVSAYWNAMYRGIYRCNLVLDYMNKTDQLVGFDEATRLQLIGEATFLRGLFHFKLQSLYGGYPQLNATFGGQLKSVPYIDHVLAASEWQQERKPIEYTWGKIEEDFKKAAELLPYKYDADNLGRATKGAANAMLAKTYLYQEKWAEAYAIANEIIETDKANYGYELMGENGEKFTIARLSKGGTESAQVPGYKWIWQPEANNCAESVFDVQHHADHTTRYPQGGEGNLVAQYYGIRRVWAMAHNPHFDDKVHYPTAPEDTLTSTEYYWGFILPTPYFIETAYTNVGSKVGNDILDPRYTYSVIKDRDSVPFYYPNEVYRNKYSDSVMYDAWGNWPSTGYATWKYFCDPTFKSVVATLADNPVNTKYFRFADLLLIGAEAAVNSGHSAEALKWINRVRTRARNCGTTGYPQDLTSVTKEAVWAERRVELAFEGHQFFDIMRTGRAQQVLKTEAMQYASVTNGATGVSAVLQFGDNFEIGKNEIWPISIDEIDLSGGILTQNPRY